VTERREEYFTAVLFRYYESENAERVKRAWAGVEGPEILLPPPRVIEEAAREWASLPKEVRESSTDPDEAGSRDIVEQKFAFWLRTVEKLTAYAPLGVLNAFVAAAVLNVPGGDPTLLAARMDWGCEWHERWPLQASRLLDVPVFALDLQMRLAGLKVINAQVSARKNAVTESTEA
jgi:hypothetical protein